jgi:hypothetical protein
LRTSSRRFGFNLTLWLVACTGAFSPPLLLRGQNITINNPAEFNAYQNAITQSDPRAKANALDSFLNAYPQSVVKKPVLVALMETYVGLNDGDHVVSTANRVLQVDPDNFEALFYSVAIRRNQCTHSIDQKTGKTDAPQTCGDGASMAFKGLAVSRPAAVSEEDWKKQTDVAYPIFHSMIALNDTVSKGPAPAYVPAQPSEPDRGFAKAASAQSSLPRSTVPIPHNYALIFATDDYAHWPHLTNPIPDGDALNQTLTSLYNFQVEEVRNPTNEQVLGKLTEYLHRTFQPQDQLMIFISGHGYFDNDLGQGFIVPSNAPLVQDDPGHTRLLAHDTIMRYVNRIPSKHVVLIIDACFAGTLDRKIADSGLRGDTSMDIYAHVSLPELIERKEPKRTRRWIASGGKDFVPDGRPGHHSPFIAALLVTLNEAADRKGYATLNDIELGLNTVSPEPRWGDIQDENDAGADFILLTPTAAAQLSKSN